MIKKLRFSNFYSFAEETEISFELGRKPTPSGFDINLPDRRLNKVIAVVGANGSGKTQFIKALAFLRWFIRESFLEQSPEDQLPYQPHALCKDKNTQFEIEFFIGEKEYKYSLKLNNREVKDEALYQRTSERFSYIFKRTRTNDSFEFKEKGFPFSLEQARKLRPNASIISAAHSYDVKEVKAFIHLFDKFSCNVNFQGRSYFEYSKLFDAANFYYKYPEVKERMIEALCKFDLGLGNVEIDEVEMRQSDGQLITAHQPWGIHKTESGELFKLSMFEESSGTQSAFVLFPYLLNILKLGGCAIIDELDNDLHPHLIPEILNWFRFEETNPHQAQLIFTCHTPEVLNLLQKHQVYLTEKNQQCSEAWRLDQVTGLRADDNLYAKYMAGALGAVPDV